MHLQAWPILDTLQTTKRRIPKSPVRQHSWWLQEVGSAWIRDFTTSTGWIIPGAAMATPKNRAGKIGRPWLMAMLFLFIFLFVLNTVEIALEGG